MTVGLFFLAHFFLLARMKCDRYHLPHEADDRVAGLGGRISAGDMDCSG